MNENNTPNKNPYDDWGIPKAENEEISNTITNNINKNSDNRNIHQKKQIQEEKNFESNSNKQKELIDANTIKQKKTTNIKRIIAIMLLIIDSLILFGTIGVCLVIAFAGFIAYFFQGLSYGAEIENSLIIYITKGVIPWIELCVPEIIFMIISFLWAKKQL